MLPIHFLLALPLAACQFPMSLEADVAYGEQNDRFDMSGMLEAQQKYFNTHGKSDSRRSGSASWSRPHVPPRRYNPILLNSRRHSRRDDNWAEDMNQMDDSVKNMDALFNNADMYARAQDSYRRVPPITEVLRANVYPKKEREITLYYSLPIKIKVVDTPESSNMIKAINIM